MDNRRTEKHRPCTTKGPSFRKLLSFYFCLIGGIFLVVLQSTVPNLGNLVVSFLFFRRPNPMFFRSGGVNVGLHVIPNI